MKLYLKLIIFLLVLAVAAPFILKGKDGLPLISIDKFKLHGGSAMPSKQLDNLISKTKNTFSTQTDLTESVIDKSTQTATVYRWKNKDGTWSYSNIPNARSEAVKIRPYQNVFPDPSQTSSSPKQKDTGTVGNGGYMLKIPSPLTIPLTEVPKLLNDAKGIQQKLNTRAEIQDTQK